MADKSIEELKEENANLREQLERLLTERRSTISLLEKVGRWDPKSKEEDNIPFVLACLFFETAMLKKGDPK